MSEGETCQETLITSMFPCPSKAALRKMEGGYWVGGVTGFDEYHLSLARAHTFTRVKESVCERAKYKQVQYLGRWVHVQE